MPEYDEIIFTVTIQEGKIVINFETPVICLRMNDQQALRLASLLMRNVQEMRQRRLQ